MDQINAALEKLVPEAFAAVREAMQRALGKRHYDVQLIGGIVLHRGTIAEMKTGEGKTFVAPLAAYLNALAGQGVHVVTVNDYLAKRDAQWIGAVFHRLGMEVGSIQHEAAYVFDPEYAATDERLRDLRPVTRREAYAADVVYGTNNEFGFDYLRDNLVADLNLRVQRGHFFAIVDEVDNILIDEARTPLIISGQGEQSTDRYTQFARLVPRLKAEEDYIIDEKFRQVAITEAGTDRMEKMLGVANLFDDDFGMARHLEQALKAEALYKRDRDYVVKDGEVVIVDEFTGRLMPGRRWSEGLHQAVEAKEGVRIQSESQDAGHRHVPELLPDVPQAGRHDRYGRDRGRGVPQDLRPRGGRGPDPRPDDPRRLRRTWCTRRRRRSGRRSPTRSPRSTRRVARCWSGRSASRSARCCPTCSSGAGSSTTS